MFSFDPELAAELAERELFLEHTRSARVLGAQALLKQCAIPTVLRTVRVLEPYIDLEGQRRYWSVLRQRELPVTV